MRGRVSGKVIRDFIVTPVNEKQVEVRSDSMWRAQVGLEVVPGQRDGWPGTR